MIPLLIHRKHLLKADRICQQEDLLFDFVLSIPFRISPFFLFDQFIASGCRGHENKNFELFAFRLIADPSLSLAGEEENFEQIIFKHKVYGKLMTIKQPIPFMNHCNHDPSKLAASTSFIYNLGSIYLGQHEMAYCIDFFSKDFAYRSFFHVLARDLFINEGLPILNMRKA